MRTLKVVTVDVDADRDSLFNRSTSSSSFTMPFTIIGSLSTVPSSTIICSTLSSSNFSSLTRAKSNPFIIEVDVTGTLWQSPSVTVVEVNRDGEEEEIEDETDESAEDESDGDGQAIGECKHDDEEVLVIINAVGVARELVSDSMGVITTSLITLC